MRRPGLLIAFALSSACSFPVDDFTAPTDGAVAADTGAVVKDTGAPPKDTAPPKDSAPTDTGTVSCPAGATACSGVCKVLADDGTACGSCTKQCDADESCLSGSCSCRIGTTPVADRCVSSGDASACGSDKKACKSDELCNGSQCRKKMEGCGIGRDQCPSGTGPTASTSCFDFNNDSLHCGACDRACLIGETCVSRICQKIFPAAGCDNCLGCTACGAARCCGKYPGRTTPTCVAGPSCPL